MFLGTYKTAFSGKGRIILPKIFREEINSSKIVLTKGLDKCIWGFDFKSWEKQSQKQLEIPLTEEKGRNLRRHIFSQAMVGELDKQGRFVILGELLDHAGIGEQVILIGAGDHFEIWDPKVWDDFKRRGK